MPFENVKYFLEILQILLDYFLFAVLTLMYHSTRGKRLQTTKGIKSCKKVQMCIEWCTRVWKKSRHSRPGQWILLLRASNFSHWGGGGGGGGGYSGFQVTGMIKGLFWVWNFQFWDFFRKENFGKLFFWVAWFKWGFFGVFQLMFVFFVLYHFMLSGNFYGLEIQLGIFLVLNFGSGIFLGFVESPRDFLGNF